MRGIKLGALHTRGKCPATEHWPRSLRKFLLTLFQLRNERLFFIFLKVSPGETASKRHCKDPIILALGKPGVSWLSQRLSSLLSEVCNSSTCSASKTLCCVNCVHLEIHNDTLGLTASWAGTSDHTCSQLCAVSVGVVLGCT